LTLKRLPAHLAVGDNVQTDAFLQRNRLVDGAIFHGAQLRCTELAGSELVLSVKQVCWAKETTDDVGVSRHQGNLSVRKLSSKTKRTIKTEYNSSVANRTSMAYLLLMLNGRKGIAGFLILG
jgi:hypothetical protein